MKKLLLSIILALTVCVSFGQSPWINEIHYDNAGGDVNEGVEVAVPSGSTCTNIEIIAYNGNNGASYGSVSDILNNPNCTPTTSNGVTFYWVDIVLQNGAPDGIALVCDGSVLQFLSYEGAFTATNNTANGLTSTDIGVTEGSSTTTTQSISLQGTGDEYSDFTWVSNVTFSHCSVNTGQIINTSSTPSIIVTPSSLTGFTYVEGAGPSTEQSYDVSGTNLTNDIVISTPANWEISTTSGGPYQTTPITLTQSSGTVNSTTIYTRMISGLLNAGSPYSGNISNTSIGATTQNVPVDGTVTVFSSLCINEEFNSGTTEPTGWNFVGVTGTYTSAGNFGNSSPSLRMDDSGDNIETETITNASELSFWIKGQGTDASSSVLVEGFNGVSWVTIETISPLPTSGTVYTYNSGTSPSLPINIEQFRFSYNKSAGNLAIDDITASCGSACTPTHTIASFSPTSGSVGTTVTITGTGFTSGSTVDFNGVSATVTFVNATTLTSVVPSGATTGVITVTEAGCTVNSATNFTITACSPSHSVSSFYPTSGPEFTEVTILGSGFTASSSVDFNGTNATVISQTSTEIIVEVPAGASTGSITVLESGCPLILSPTFTITNSNNCSLAGAIPSGWSDLLISGVYDDSVSSCHYIELLNPTTAAIDLADYTIGFDNNFTLGSAVPVTGFNGIVPLSGTIQAESSYMIQVTTISGGCSSCPTITPDYTYIGSNGLNDEDRLVLVQNYGTGSATAQDVWQNHSNGTGYNVGYVFARDFASTAPSSTFSNSDWILNGTEDCFGFAISGTTPPSVITQPSDVIGCNSATFNITATAGNGGTLTYQWLYNNGSNPNWNNVTSADFSTGTVTGETTNTLNITGFDLTGYQFYCQVIEDGTCSVTSNAAQFQGSSTTTWSAGSWDNGLPTLSTVVIINDTYNTGTDGNIEACNLYINTGNTLTVSANSNITIQNSIYNNGGLIVQHQGSVVQIDDAGIYDDSGSALGSPTTVEKLTSTLDAWYEYTYWSSPVFGETFGNALFQSSPYRRFSFNAANFIDSTYETNNDNTTTIGAGIDDIDDDGNDWQLMAGTDALTPGVGYAATHSIAAFSGPNNYNYSFRGPLNTGTIVVSVERNDTELGDTNWNLIGNPYPSAIDADLFFTENNFASNPTDGKLDGAIYLWSQATPPSATTNGNEVLNFSNNDYAVINGAAEVAGGDLITPNRFIPSGQGFFVTYSNSPASTSGNVRFNNAMRVNSNNDQFFRTTNQNGIDNKIWVNLTSDLGVHNQIAVAYVNGATADNDGEFYDAKKSGAILSDIALYSLIPNNDKKLAIQGKSPQDINLSEVIYLGFINNIEIPSIFTISIDHLQGDFLLNNTAYLKDNLLNTHHNLTNSDYVFTSDQGEFNNRFEIVFTNPALSVDEFTLNNENTSIISLPNDEIKVTAPKHLKIKNVTIYDALGRKIIKLKGQENTETYQLNNISQAVYLAEIELSNKQIVTKKFIKK
ncbi:IPT/TIG domain-containing protein [Mesoflavibacter profundi]|uniref:IPT/TIG domain-containing protein n=1 Tax=Mesoflavibacter profundi TaxID=2708110 RepID=UPI003516062A